MNKPARGDRELGQPGVDAARARMMPFTWLAMVAAMASRVRTDCAPAWA